MTARIIKHPKSVRYNNGNDSSGLKRKHDRMFGEGSWEEMEKGVLERYPEFKEYREPEKAYSAPSRRWWEFGKPKTNVTILKCRKK